MPPFLPDDLWLLPMLKMISRRPGMFLGSERSFALELYLRGYEQARDDLGLCRYSPREDRLLSDFRVWLSRRIDREDASWSSLIDAIDSRDANIGTFFKCFDEFLFEKFGQLLSEMPVQKWPPNSGFKS